MKVPRATVERVCAELVAEKAAEWMRRAQKAEAHARRWKALAKRLRADVAELRSYLGGMKCVEPDCYEPVPKLGGVCVRHGELAAAIRERDEAREALREANHILALLALSPADAGEG